jgi:hypothetical protein
MIKRNGTVVLRNAITPKYTTASFKGDYLIGAIRRLLTILVVATISFLWPSFSGHGRY